MFICKYKEMVGLIRQQKSASLEGKLLFHIYIYSNPKRYEHFVWTQLQPNIQI